MFGSRSAVKRGISFLDRHYPQWIEHINVETLDVGFNEVCMLGQLFGSFENGQQVLGLIPLQAEWLGFNTWIGNDHEELTACWKSAIEKRLQYSDPFVFEQELTKELATV
jgi:hypothetical protein